MSAGTVLERAKKDKARFVRRMFGRIAGRYDLGNRVLSLGRDQAWRRRAVAVLAPEPHEVMLDIGAGTADLALELSRHVRTVVAADFSQPMLDVGLQKARKARRESNIAFVMSDAMGLPFPEGSFDGVTSAFTVRNFARLEDGFGEMCRVLKPGGRMLSLEFTRPASNLLSFLYRPYLNRFLPFIGGRITGDRSAYAYLAESINDFPAPDELAACIRRAGLRQVEYRLLNFGTVAIHLAYKGGAARAGAAGEPA